MRRIVWFAVLLLSPVAMLAAQAADEPSMTGLWKTDSAIMGQPVRMMCALTETKNNLSGVCSGEQDGYSAHKIAGTVKGQKVQFYFQAVWGGNSLTTIVSGTLNQDRTQIDGDMIVKPMGGGTDAGPMDMSGALTAVRELAHDTAALQAHAEAAQTDAVAAQTWAAEARAEMAAGNGTPAAPAQPIAAGVWKVSANIGDTPVKITCTLEQKQQKLAGTCTGGGDDDTAARPLTGEVTDKGITWRVAAVYQGKPIAVSMRAVLDDAGTKMYGSMSVAPLDADGTFLAEKQAEPASPATAP
jgi:outer membrane murein-binding lipoprotein Lpp